MRTEWAERAAQRYDASSARHYRAHDDRLDDSAPYTSLVHWLQSVRAAFPAPIDVLDFGCGTGRYFWAVQGVRHLVGLDASPAMLREAATPLHADRITAERITLVEGDLMTQDFAPASFDLVYAIGVLAEHVPLGPGIVDRVHRWLRNGGRFAFTTVHPDSPSVPSTVRRRLGRAVSRVIPAPGLPRLRERLLAGGLYADEPRVRSLLADRFALEGLERFESEAHLHCRCVARKFP